MQIELSTEITDMAKTVATSHGYPSLVAFIEEAVEEKVNGSASLESGVTDADEWIRKLNAIGQRHRSTGYAVDDSRDSIYPDRV